MMDTHSSAPEARSSTCPNRRLTDWWGPKSAHFLRPWSRAFSTGIDPNLGKTQVRATSIRFCGAHDRVRQTTEVVNGR